MKKIFIILALFSLIACIIIVDFDIETEWGKVKMNPKSAIRLMKKLGVFNPIVELLRDQTEEVAIDYCMEQIGIKIVCKEMVNMVLDEVFR